MEIFEENLFSDQIGFIGFEESKMMESALVSRPPGRSRLVVENATPALKLDNLFPVRSD